jgi:phosphoglycolate phosphatase
MISNPQRPFDLIAFDWDGTLFDSTQLITRCIQAAVEDVGGQRPHAMQASYVIGMPLMAALAHAAPDVPEHLYPQLGERYRFHYQKKEHELALFDGVIDLLEWLKAEHYVITIATGKSRAGLNAALHFKTLKGLIDDSRTADETAGKPDPLMLHELMSLYGALPTRTLMIGDTSHDLEMAKRAGCPSAAVTYGAHEDRELKKYSPLIFANSVQDLWDWFKSFHK